MISEGGKLGVTIQVTNAVAGQTFDLWHANTMDTADFTNSLEADLKAALPAGVTVTMLGPMRARIVLKEGTYAFTLLRETALDGVVETADQGVWWEGRQEQTDIFISDFTGGLTADATVVSTWVTDADKQEPSLH